MLTQREILVRTQRIALHTTRVLNHVTGNALRQRSRS